MLSQSDRANPVASISALLAATVQGDDDCADTEPFHTSLPWKPIIWRDATCRPFKAQREASAERRVSAGTLVIAPSRVQLTAAAAAANLRISDGAVTLQQRVDERGAKDVARAGRVDGFDGERRHVMKSIALEQHGAVGAQRDAQPARRGWFRVSEARARDLFTGQRRGHVR